MSEIGFLVFYVIGLIPTYILPYFGSNSYAAKAVGAGFSAVTGTHTNFSFSLTILHIGALALCIAIAWVRGKSTNKGWIVVLPILAAIFDLAPALNMIPLVPTVLHVFAMVKGFMPADTDVNDDAIPEPRTILLLIGGIIGGTIVLAVGNWATSTKIANTEVKQFVEKQERDRVASDDERKLAEQRRVEASSLAAEAQARTTADAARIKAASQQEVDTATAKFKEIESSERAAFEAREQLLNQFSNTEIQSRLNRFASALNKGDAATAAAVMGVPLTSVYPFVQDAVVVAGINQAQIREFNLRPGSFKFQTTYAAADYAKNGAPTGYKIDATQSSLDISVKFYGVKMVGGTREVRTCLFTKYTVEIDTPTQQPKFSIGASRRVDDGFDSSCGKG